MDNKVIQFSNQINQVDRMMTKDFFYLYYTPLILTCILPILDLTFSTNGFILLSVSVITFWMAIRHISNELNRINQTYQWVKDEGIVISKAIVNLSSICKSGHYPFTPKIIYSYIYQGKEYKSDIFAMGVFGVKGCNRLFSEVDEAKKYVDRLIRHNKITIYINPRNPKESVIKRGVSNESKPSYVLLIVSYLFPIIIFFALFLASQQ